MILILNHHFTHLIYPQNHYNIEYSTILDTYFLKKLQKVNKFSKLLKDYTNGY